MHVQAGTVHEACLVNADTDELEPVTIRLIRPIAAGGQGVVRFRLTDALAALSNPISSTGECVPK